MSLSKITTCLWFDGQAEEAAKYYTSIFPDSAITETQFYNRGGQETHQHEPGTVLTVAFHLKGHPFVGLNGGSHFKFNEAVSFQIECEDQAEVDYYWDKLGEGGAEERKVCGWLGDKFGVSWQVVPKQLIKYLREGDEEQRVRVTVAMMAMKKMDIQTLTNAFEGK